MTLINLEYWPPISHFKRLYNSKHVQVHLGGTYQKQSYFNRCKIAGVNGVLTLSVPIIGGREQKAFQKDILIDHSQRWAVQQLRTLRSCYGKSPFFDYYFPVVENLLSQQYSVLSQLNTAILQQVIKWLKWDGELFWSNDFHIMEKEAEVALPPYVQVFAGKQPFFSDLSILDALFCLGPHTKDYLKEEGSVS